MIITIEKRVLIEYWIYSKIWLLNTPRVVEVIVLLNIVKIICEKSRHISRGGITIAMDNKVL